MNNTLNQKKDIYWINALKAICMIFIFFGHSELFYNLYFSPVDWFRLSFNTNAFFFVSGYLLFWKQLTSPRIDADVHQFISGGLKKTLANILFRIVIPSVLFSLVVFFPKNFLRGDTFTMREFLYDTIGGTTCWFTSALAVAEIILLFLLITRKRSIWFYVPFCFVLSCFGWWLADNGINMIQGTSSFPWHYKQALISLSYIIAGGVYWRYEEQIRKVLHKWVLVVLTIAFAVVILLYHDKMEFITSLNRINLLGYIVTIWATILLIELCRCIPEIKALSFIGQNTMGYYFLSGGVPNVIAILAIKIMPNLHWWMLLLIWILSLIVATLVIIILNQRLPWFFDLRLFRTKKND